MEIFNAKSKGSSRKEGVVHFFPQGRKEPSPPPSSSPSFFNFFVDSTERTSSSPFIEPWSSNNPAQRCSAAMGIKGLTKLLGDNAERCVKEHDLKSFFGRK